MRREAGDGTPRENGDDRRLGARDRPVEGVLQPRGPRGLADPGRGFFTLAGDKGVATTTIRISAGGGASAEIEEIWVQPSARGQGMGGRLLRTAVAECRRRGIESIELRVTPDDQELGIPDFYTKQGFSHGGRLIYEFAGADSEVR